MWMRFATSTRAVFGSWSPGRRRYSRPPSPLPVEPELAGAVEVLGLVFQVEAAAADDLVRRPAAPPPGEGQRAVLAVDGHDPARVRAAHHPAHGGPHDGVLVVLLRLALVDVVLVERQVPLPAIDRRDVVERLAGVLPGPPLALDVVRVGDRPVRRAGQGDARHGAVLPDRPDAARGPGEVDVPDLFRLGDQAVRGALRPARHGLRAADDGRPLAPGRVAGQEDRCVRGARLMGVQLAPVVDALLEHVGVRPLAGRRLAAGAGVPGVVLPGTSASRGRRWRRRRPRSRYSGPTRPAGTRRARGAHSRSPVGSTFACGFCQDQRASSWAFATPCVEASRVRITRQRPVRIGVFTVVAPGQKENPVGRHLERSLRPSPGGAVSGTGATEVPLSWSRPALFRRTREMPAQDTTSGRVRLLGHDPVRRPRVDLGHGRSTRLWNPTRGCERQSRERSEPHLPVEPRHVRRGEAGPSAHVARLPAEVVRHPRHAVPAPFDDDLRPLGRHHREEAVRVHALEGRDAVTQRLERPEDGDRPSRAIQAFHRRHHHDGPRRGPE